MHFFFFSRDRSQTQRSRDTCHAFRAHTFLLALMLLACVPVTSLAQATIPSVIDAIATALQPLVTILFGIGFLVFIWSVASFVRASGSDTDLTAARKRIMWSVVGLFFIASLWGIVSIVRTMFGVDSTSTCTSSIIKTDGSTVTVQSCM